jgi:hypothetical protein
MFELQSDEPVVVTFLPQEFRVMKINKPGPSGLLGGWQRMENWIVQSTDRKTLKCVFPAEKLAQLKYYMTHYGQGGPNSRVREACAPALKRAGINIYRR